MRVIHQIYWDIDTIGLLTNQLSTEEHKHWMPQLFIGLEDDVELIVRNQVIHGHCIIVDKNVPHQFSTNGKLYLSIVIEPASPFCQHLEGAYGRDGYVVYDEVDVIKGAANQLLIQNTKENYRQLIQNIYELAGYARQVHQFDQRIQDIFTFLDTCTCENHTLEKLAQHVFLSESRLSHLFKQEVGLPLKEFIILHQVERAVQEINDGKSITEAAQLAGFNSSAHFASTVKKMMGMPITKSLQDSVFLKVYAM